MALKLKGLLSDCELLLTPLTSDQEGHLRGGFGSISVAAITTTNSICNNSSACKNDSCNNSSCNNTSCGNTDCTNGICTNDFCIESTKPAPTKPQTQPAGGNSTTALCGFL